MTTINIELKPKSKVRELFHKIYIKIEDTFFSLILKLPEHFIPSFLMEHIEYYLLKRTQELQRQIIKQRWQQVTLEKAVSDIRDKKKAPQED